MNNDDNHYDNEHDHNDNNNNNMTSVYFRADLRELRREIYPAQVHKHI